MPKREYTPEQRAHRLLKAKERYRQQKERLGAMNRANIARRYAENPTPFKAAARAARRELLVNVKNLLGGTCECCGEAEFEFLALDHKHGDGGGMKRRSYYYSYMEVRRAFDSGDAERIAAAREKFRLLCFNCNMSARNAAGVCAHRREGRPQAATAGGNRMRERFAYARAALGGACVCCGEKKDEFLTIDHVNGDGAKERRTAEGKRDVQSYYLKIERAFKGGDAEEIKAVRAAYRVMCHNCNQSRERGEGACLHTRDVSKHPEFPYRSVSATRCG